MRPCSDDDVSHMSSDADLWTLVLSTRIERVLATKSRVNEQGIFSTFVCKGENNVVTTMAGFSILIYSMCRISLAQGLDWRGRKEITQSQGG